MAKAGSTDDGASGDVRRRRLLALASIFVTHLAVELVVRMMPPPQMRDPMSSFALRSSKDPRLGNEFVPNSTFATIYDGDPRGILPPGGRVEYRINTLGLRGPEQSVIDGADARRVLVLGDSFGFGTGVAHEGTLPAQLESALQERAPPGVRYQSFNAGVPGYTTRQELAQLERFSPVVRPHVVVVAYMLNDVMSEEEAQAELQNLFFERMDMTGGGTPSALVNLISYRFRNRLHGGRMNDMYRSYYTGDRREEWERTARAFAEMAEHCKERDIHLVVAVYPFLHEFDSYPYRDVHDMIVRTCKELGIDVIDLLPMLEKYENRELWVHPTDPHPNAQAHGYSAQVIAEVIDGKHAA